MSAGFKWGISGQAKVRTGRRFGPMEEPEVPCEDERTLNRPYRKYGSLDTFFQAHWYFGNIRGITK